MYVQIVIVKHKAAVATLYPVRNKTLGVCPADNGVSNGVNFIRIVTPPLSKKAAHVKKAKYTDFPPLFVPDWLPLCQGNLKNFIGTWKIFD